MRIIFKKGKNGITKKKLADDLRQFFNDNGFPSFLKLPDDVVLEIYYNSLSNQLQEERQISAFEANKKTFTFNKNGFTIRD